jgi:hypothetical protein
MGENVADRRPVRQGEAWTEGEYEQLVRDLTDGLTLEQIAARLKRTAAGIHSQIRHLVPENTDVGRPVTRGREEWLRHQLAADPGYDWRTVLRCRTDSDASLLWTHAEDEQLRAGWRNTTPLSELASQLQMSESAIVRRLSALNLAENVVAVVDRLGASPGGSVEARARYMRGELAEALYVLVVEHTPRPKVSIHHSQTDAEEQLRRTIGDPARPDRRWWVLRRTLDGRDTGQWWTNTSAKLRLQMPSRRTGNDNEPSPWAG